jgi:hypothetical protein
MFQFSRVAVSSAALVVLIVVDVPGILAVSRISSVAAVLTTDDVPSAASVSDVTGVPALARVPAVVGVPAFACVPTVINPFPAVLATLLLTFHDVTDLSCTTAEPVAAVILSAFDFEFLV